MVIIFNISYSHLNLFCQCYDSIQDELDILIAKREMIFATVNTICNDSHYWTEHSSIYSISFFKEVYLN